MNKIQQLNKKIAFDNYKRKNYLEQYSFFISHGYKNEYLFITADSGVEYLRASHFHEIKSPHTLVKYVKMVKDGKMKFNIVTNRCQEIATFNELKTNTLIERLAGLL